MPESECSSALPSNVETAIIMSCHVQRKTHLARYSFHTAIHFLLLIAGLVLLPRAESLVTLVVIALMLSLAIVQLGFLAHDALHWPIARGRRASEGLGYLLWNVVCGVSTAWWRDKHLRHHRHPNEAGLDPDLYAVFAFGTSDAGGRTGVLRLIARHQAPVSLVLVACTAAYFQIMSLLFLLRQKPDHWGLETVLLAIRHGVFFGIVFTSLGATYGLLFLACHYAAVGWYLGAVFATNHYGLPVLAAGADDSERMFAVTRNVRTGRIGEYLFGGLNYQIEHHLWPSLPRFALREAAVQLSAERIKRRLPYHESGWGEALLAVLREFHATGADLRGRQRAAQPG